MFSESAELYDVIYGTFKDYLKEVQQIVALLQARHPGARAILDVGCGTGEHARILAENHGFEVDGIDLDAGMIRLARAKKPGARFEVADMIDFDLGRRYDAILCLFSSIGYVRTVDNVRRTLRSFRRHLNPEGIVLVEPWFAPGVLEPGRIHAHASETGATKVCRMGRTTLDGRLSRLEFEYLIGELEGIRRASEVHELGLFTVDEMLQAFRAEQFEVEHDPVGLIGRGLYLARMT